MSEYHVVQSIRGQWVAKRKYAVRATKTFLTKAQAIRWAESRADVLVTHNQNGLVDSIRHTNV